MEYTFEAMVRGYHVNCEIWSSTIGERLSYVWRSIPSKQWFVAITLTMRYGAPLLERVHPTYVREAENYQDPFAVAVDRLGVIIGHVPRRILFMCSMYALEMGWLYRLQNNFSYVLFCETFPKED